MTFVVAMTIREMRASWRRLLFFFLCLSIGVGAIVAIRSVIQSVRQVFAGEARALITADAIITSNRAFDESVDRHHRLAARRVPTRPATSRSRSRRWSAAPSRPAAMTRMVELRAVEAGFPFYGELKLANGQRYDYALLEDFGVLARPELLAQLNLAVGDALLIGTKRFTIRGVIEAEPGRRLGAFSLGPRVFISREALEQTGLLGFGSRASFQRLVKVPDAQARCLVASLRRDFANTFARVRSYKATEDDIGEDFARAENYLSLVGLVIVILGGIGVSSVTRVFVQQKIRSIAILKCVGGRSGQLLTIYMAQVVALGLAGSVFGVLLAGIAIAAIPSTLAAAATPGVVVDYSLTGAGGAAGIRHRPARVRAVLARAAARHPARQAVAAAAGRSHGPQAATPSRLPSRSAWSLGSGRSDRVAGRLASRRRASSRSALPRAALVLHLAGTALITRHQAVVADALVPAAPRGAAAEPARQPGADRPAGRRPRQLLHRRRALAAGEPDQGVHLQPVAGHARHVPARRAAGPGRRR